MKRTIVGLLLVLHGLAHAGAGVWAAGVGSLWMVTLLWGAAMLGYMAAGFGVLRVPRLMAWWREILLLATIASFTLILAFAPVSLYIGLLIGLALAVLAIGLVREDDEWLRVSRPRGRVASALTLMWMVYALGVVVVRPVYLRWGTTPADRMTSLPGDELAATPTYRVDHAITIHAPAHAVWPWLAQLGQDRGGFYSYAWLERMVGDHITNADRIHPEWQRRAIGDTVRATQPGYLGTRSTLGWRVVGLEPGRALILENWGALVVQPVDSETSRLVVRTRGEGKPTLLTTALSPLSVFVFEPAHFIMQRGMLRGIRDRAERAAATLPLEGS
jgi:hypothetical protein